LWYCKLKSCAYFILNGDVDVFLLSGAVVSLIVGCNQFTLTVHKVLSENVANKLPFSPKTAPGIEPGYFRNKISLTDHIVLSQLYHVYLTRSYLQHFSHISHNTNSKDFTFLTTVISFAMSCSHNHNATSQYNTQPNNNKNNLQPTITIFPRLYKKKTSATTTTTTTTTHNHNKQQTTTTHNHNKQQQ